MREQYNATQFTVEEDEWPPYQPKHYTTLALIHHKDEPASIKVLTITKQLAMKGNVEPQISADDSDFNLNVNSKELYKNATNDIADLFAVEKNSDGSTFVPNMILIEGAPGVGKTVFSKEIAFQWATNNFLISKKLLFLVALRNFDSKYIKSVEDLVQHVLQCGDAEMVTGITKYVTQNGGADLVIVLDGYDEMADVDRQESLVAEILLRQVLPNCLLVIFSRPTASLHLHNSVDCRVVEIVGFTEENRLHYIKTSSPESYENIKVYLESHPTIDALCYIPLNMTILLCLAKAGIQNLPDTQTEMYRQFIEMSVKHVLKQKNSHLTITSLSELPLEYRHLFDKVAQFAYESLKRDQLVFTLDELDQVCPNLANTPTDGLGLLTPVKSFNQGEQTTYNFLHFSIQEYMAAYHISTLSDDEQIVLLKDTFWTVRYYNTWIMYAGITGGNSFALKHFLSGNWFQFSSWLFETYAISPNILNDKIKCLHVFQCLAETKDDIMVSLVESLFQDQIINLSNQTLLPRDLGILGLFLIRSHTRKWKKLDLSNCNLGIDGCKNLSKMLLNKDAYRKVRINSIDLSCNQLNRLPFIELFNLFKCWCTTEVVVNDSSILVNMTISELLTSLENAFIVCNTVTSLQTVSIGSFLFAYKLNGNHILSNVTITNCDSLYLLKCTISEEPNFLFSLHQQNALNIHFLETPINEIIVKAIGDMLINDRINSLYIYDSSLSDEVADEIGRLIMNNDASRIMLVVSKTKIQGIINTCSLSSELSNLEILNLIVKIRLLCRDVIPTISWCNNLHFYDNKNEAIIQCLSDSLFSTIAAHIKLKVIEGKTMIAHKVGFTNINSYSSPFSPVIIIHLSACDLSDKEYEIITGKGALMFLNIVHSYVKVETVCVILSRNVSTLREVFIHTNCTVTKENIVAL